METGTLRYKWWYWVTPIGLLTFAAFLAYAAFLPEFNLIGNALILGTAAVCLFHAIKTLVARVALGPDFIEERSLFRRNRVYFAQVTAVELTMRRFAFCSAKKCVSIGSDTVNGSELGIDLLNKIRTSRDIEIKGDILAFKRYGLLRETHDGEQLPVRNSDRTLTVSVWKVEAIEKRWLFRRLRLRTQHREYDFVYVGRGKGFEAILIDDQFIAVEQGVWWYVPKFAFVFEGRKVEVFVNVAPWLTISSFTIVVDGWEIYREGKVQR